MKTKCFIQGAALLLFIILSLFGCVYPHVILIHNFGLIYFSIEQFFKNLQAFCKINFMAQMWKMHKGEEENYQVNQVFLMKLVTVLSFINNQHPETSHSFPHFPKLFHQIQNKKSDVFLTVKPDNFLGHSHLPRLSSELFS